MRGLVPFAMVVLVVLGGPPTARATVGGPVVIEVLGVDGDGKVYFTETRHDESGIPPQLYFIGPGGAPVAVRSWYATGSAGGGDDWHAIEARIERLRARLTRLPPAAASSLRLERRVVRRGSHRVAVDLPPVPSVGLALRLTRSDGATAATEVTAYRSERAAIERIFTLPDGPSLAVVSFVGIPEEITYERQIVVLVPSS